MADISETSGGTMANQQPITLVMLEPVGKIGPEGRLDTEAIDHACEVVASDAVYSAVESNSLDHCYDGRSNKGGNTLGAKAAGGTNTIVAGLALIGERNPADSASQHAARVAEDLHQHGKRVGGHVAAEIHGDASIDCGCGAADREHDALMYIAAYRDELRDFLGGLGIEVSSELSEEIGLRAQALFDEGYAAREGRKVVEEIGKVGGEACIETLEGAHKEVAAVLNLAEGTTLDKDKLRELLGDDVQAFGVDVWAIKQNAYELETDPAEAHKLFVAMLYYNLGVAAVLCNRSLRVVVHQ
jgi:DNA-binding ferritin-like protein (Dps family)